MDASTEVHFNFVKELCDQYDVNCELNESAFPSIRLWPKEPYVYEGIVNVTDYCQMWYIFFEECKLVKNDHGKVIQYKDFNSYFEQIMDLHY